MGIEVVAQRSASSEVGQLLYPAIWLAFVQPRSQHPSIFVQHVEGSISIDSHAFCMNDWNMLQFQPRYLPVLNAELVLVSLGRS